MRRIPVLEGIFEASSSSSSAGRYAIGWLPPSLLQAAAGGGARNLARHRPPRRGGGGCFRRPCRAAPTCRPRQASRACPGTKTMSEKRGGARVPPAPSIYALISREPRSATGLVVTDRSNHSIFKLTYFPWGNGREDGDHNLLRSRRLPLPGCPGDPRRGSRPNRVN